MQLIEKDGKEKKKKKITWKKLAKFLTMCELCFSEYNRNTFPPWRTCPMEINIWDSSAHAQ